MGDLVNLNQMRKAREKKARERQAAANRVRFGRDKAERQRSTDDQNRLNKDLDGKVLAPDTGAPDRDPKA
jgi:hypothetical protein